MWTLTVLTLVPGCRGWEWAWGDDDTVPSDWSIHLLGTRTCPTPPHERLEPGTTRLGVEIELRAGRNQVVPANYFYATLEGENRSIQADLAGCEPALSGAPLRDGERARGFLNFVVPSGSRSLELVYSPALGGDASGNSGSPREVESKRLALSPDSTSSARSHRAP